MARLPRLSVEGVPHLVAQRSPPDAPAFRDESDRVQFRALLAEVARVEGVAIHAYALRDDGLRLLATPRSSEGLGRIMQALGRRYGAAFNRRHGRSGSLWEGRFRAALIEPGPHLLDAMLFVEGAADAAGSEPLHGSATTQPHHLGHRHDPVVNDHAVYWALGNTPFDREAAYGKLFHDGLGRAANARFVEALRSGWPVGSDQFLATLASKTPRRLTPLKAGRPRKATV